jgi:hypothetical protein
MTLTTVVLLVVLVVLLVHLWDRIPIAEPVKSTTIAAILTIGFVIVIAVLRRITW